MDSQQFNRIEYDVGQWRSREERLAKIFSSALSSKPILAEKLRYFDLIAARYSSTTDQDEKFALSVLKQERREIERKLYFLSNNDISLIIFAGSKTINVCHDYSYIKDIEELFSKNTPMRIIIKTFSVHIYM